MIEVVKTAHGRMLVDSRDKWIGGSYLSIGEYNFYEAEVIRHYCEPGTVVMDVGANIGAVAVEMARAVGDAGIVVAIEPQHLVWQLLVANVAINELRNVIPLNVAAGREPGSIIVPDTLETKEQYVNSGGLELGGQAHGHGRKTAVIRLDDLPHNNRRVSMIKIDVEGMEPDVILGAAGIITRDHPVVYFEIDRPTWDKAVSLLNQLGYRCFVHQPPLFREGNFAGCIKSPFGGNIVSCNAIAIHGDSHPKPMFEHCYGEMLIGGK